MEVRLQKFIKREDIKANPKTLYIFGDNVKRVGLGGQAKEMRGEPNSFGIATKLAPTYNPDDFMKDKPEHMAIVQKDIDTLFELLKIGFYDALVIPEDGIGTGIANLKENAPIILMYINQVLFKDIPTKWLTSY